ncbi:MAG: hypothetical protein C3F12_00290 [Candidatus Methylomirabilota bacterium]|nr:hypothetical protein [Candidatus Methylomirabilis sp.]NJD68522.1 hypothetical protein [candidate division NC10 bacterium]PWB48973.1 MAG: hypothetical protein C3F12_00290 [candidate division NC10 bacterium]
MSKVLKKRRYASSIKIDGNIRCQRVYPIEDGKSQNKPVEELQTVGIKLSRNQAIQLALVLLAASQEWSEIDITVWRLNKRQSDGTYTVTVTSPRES